METSFEKLGAARTKSHREKYEHGEGKKEYHGALAQTPSILIERRRRDQESRWTELIRKKGK